MAIDAGERRAAWIATATALVVVATFVAGKAARDAILLTSFNIRTLPIFISISALISMPIILVAGRLMTRFGPARLMPILNLASAMCAIVEWSLLSRYPRPTTIAIYFHLSTSGAVLVSGFWSIINERFDVQSAKRYIGRIGMGATLGGIAGGLLAEGTAVYLSPNAILLVLAGFQAICATALYLVRGTPGPPPTAPRFALGVVSRSRLLRTLAGILVLGAIAAGVLDYVFKADIVATVSKGGLLRSLAIYYTVTSVITAIVQVAVCGPLISRLGVPRSVATLPLVVTAFGLVALAVPGAISAIVARAAETVTRSSIYRAGYELLYAPLPEADKRPTKIVLDVGAERVGDLLGAQLVALLVYLLVDARIGLLIAVVAIGAIATYLAIRLPRAYTTALEESLVARADPEVVGPKRWPIAAPIIGQEGDAWPLPSRILDYKPRQRATRNMISTALAELQSPDPAKVRRALATELAPELAGVAIGLVARDDVGGEAVAALRAIAPRCTGTVVDALLDQAREVVTRRRLPDVLLAGSPELAAWGLWRGLADPSFEVRYRCGAVLSKLAMSGKLADVTSETVFEAVRRELVIDPTIRKLQHAAADLVIAATEDDRDREDGQLRHAGSTIAHVFTVLGLVLPAEPLRIALHAIQTDDSALRETALEYLASILPPDVRAQLWPLLESEDVVVATRSPDELVEALQLAYPTIRAKLSKQHAPPP